MSPLHAVCNAIIGMPPEVSLFSLPTSCVILIHSPVNALRNTHFNASTLGLHGISICRILSIDVDSIEGSITRDEGRGQGYQMLPMVEISISKI